MAASLAFADLSKSSPRSFGERALDVAVDDDSRGFRMLLEES